MTIDNGRRRSLIISGVFDGICGESGGLLSFIPNLAARAPEAARGGLLDGEPVVLAVARDGAGPFYSATYRRAK